jgi:hypothetical protein
MKKRTKYINKEKRKFKLINNSKIELLLQKFDDLTKKNFRKKNLLF